jgi:hypothetical protein
MRHKTVVSVNNSMDVLHMELYSGTCLMDTSGRRMPVY